MLLVRLHMGARFIASSNIVGVRRRGYLVKKGIRIIMANDSFSGWILAILRMVRSDNRASIAVSRPETSVAGIGDIRRETTVEPLYRIATFLQVAPCRPCAVPHSHSVVAMRLPWLHVNRKRPFSRQLVF